MWFDQVQLQDPKEIEQFEEAFRFLFPPAFRSYLMELNGARGSQILIPTDLAQRPVTAILDFRKGCQVGSESAWNMNRIMRQIRSEKRVVFGRSGRHLLCMERNRRDRNIVLWNHITQKFEPVTVSVEEFIEQTKKGA